MVCSLFVALVVKTPNSSDVLSEARQINAEKNDGQNWWEADAAEGTEEGETLIIPQN